MRKVTEWKASTNDGFLQLGTLRYANTLVI